MRKILIIIEGPVFSGKTTLARKIRETKKHVQLFSPSGLCSFFKMNKVHLNYLRTVYKSKFKADEQIYVLERSLFTNYIYFNDHLNRSNLSRLEKKIQRKNFNKDLHDYIKLIKKCRKKFNRIIYVSMKIDEDVIKERVDVALEEKHNFIKYTIEEVLNQSYKYNLLDDYIQTMLGDSVEIKYVNPDNFEKIFET